MQLSLDGGTIWGAWEPFVASKVVTLPAGDGSKRVQGRFRDLTGNTSAVVSSNSATITTAPAPATVTAPAADPDGSYALSWSAVATPGVTYTLEEATNDTFTTGKRSAYTGTATTVTITARTKGLAYYYRVRSNKTGWASSGWTVAGNDCKVAAPAAPAGITIPATDADGSYLITWLASPTAGVTYTLEEATNADFSENRQTLYSGSSRTFSLTGRTAGTIYYYRVKATKTDFPDSIWKAGTAGCKVGVLAAPSVVVVPASDADGSYAVSWSASPTPGASYEVQEAINSTFTLGLRTLLPGAATSLDISGRVAAKTYFYRVRAIKSGFTATAYATAANGCIVMLP